MTAKNETIHVMDELVKVRFNARTQYQHTRTYDQLTKGGEKATGLYETDAMKLNSYLQAEGTRYPLKEVYIGDEVWLRRWIYEENKDRTAPVPISFDHYTNKAGQRIPFDAAEALRHGEIKDTTEMVKKVKLMELLEDPKQNNFLKG